ncbi:MAG: Mrp/NBP35 family ATP-binding protein [Acidimicrobiia bacterium]|nr:Mrp/NBP35 family ATP-binding protein [Acidimicrobiia bacterium]MDH3470486.1 Mrp/NBP35 family ATP-binding protein [Acidimicrobiia bacterium]
MPSISDVESALRGVMDPELGGDIIELGMVPKIELSDEGDATIHVALTIAACPMRDQIEGDVVRKVEAMPGIRSAKVEVTAMTQSQRSDLMAKARFMAREEAQPTQVNPMTRVIAVGSGKGGVGKSSVSVNLAVALKELGYKIGVLDADIWGFSLPRMLGATGRLEANEDRKIVPEDANGIQLVSTGLLVETEDTALMWRGLMLSKALEQFLQDVAWDQDLDYLILDLPPGTGDIQMALARLLPQAEMIVVTTPQKAAQKVAARVADMARRSFMPVVGIIENMSGFTTPSGEHFDLFGVGGGQELADELGVPLITQVPLDPEVVAGGDGGAPVVSAKPDSPSAEAFRQAAKQLTQLVPPVEDETCTARIKVLEDQLERLQADSTDA